MRPPTSRSGAAREARSSSQSCLDRPLRRYRAPTDVGGHIARELARMLAADRVERRSELAQRVTHRGTSPTPWNDVVAAAIADRVPSPPAIVAPRG